MSAPHRRTALRDFLTDEAVATIEEVRSMGLDAVGALLLGQGDSALAECGVMADAFEAAGAVALGGTVPGEHAIGTLKSCHLRVQLGDDVLDMTRRVKAAPDPLGIVNPEKRP